MRHHLPHALVVLHVLVGDEEVDPLLLVRQGLAVHDELLAVRLDFALHCFAVAAADELVEIFANLLVAGLISAKSY